MDVPEDALELHGSLIELYSTGSSVVNDLITAGRYQLGMTPILTQYEVASNTFNQSLQTATDSGNLLTAMSTYQKVIGSIMKQAGELTPPTIGTNSHERLIDNLQTMHDGIAEMIAAVEKGDTIAVEAASEKMSSVSAGNERLETEMLADREADLKAYNTQIMKMSALLQKIHEEEAALRERFET
ncbi:MAG: hypothetical protein C4534_03590 [Gaiellales bacterium]|nr:MAG: hypothetical protein C4534_03590 [Gaiellales bacterium]